MLIPFFIARDGVPGEDSSCYITWRVNAGYIALLYQIFMLR